LVDKKAVKEKKFNVITENTRALSQGNQGGTWITKQVNKVICDS
jgi:hypothetical protein